jgi:L-gulonate 5-dehydrogenase
VELVKEQEMKSIVIQKPNELVIETRPLAEPAAGEVRVKVKLACHRAIS